MTSTTGYFARHREPGYWGDIARHFDRESVLLDLGCGTGWMAAHFERYTGLERSVAAVSEAQRLGRNVVHGDLGEPLSFPDDTFDAVIIKDVLEHVLDPIAVVLEARRVLRPGGNAYACTPDNQRWVWEDYTHRRPYPLAALQRLFTDNGFVVVSSGYETVVPGSSIVSGWTAAKRRPAPLRMLGRVPLIRRNSWVVTTKS